MCLLKGPNKVACEFLHCDMASKKKNLTPAVIIAIFLDIVVPMIMTILFFNILVAFPTSVIISDLFSLSFLSTLMVILGVNVIFFIVIGIILLVISLVLYCGLFFEIGLYALIPIGMYVLGFLVSFIPIIGGLLNLIFRLVPWVIVTVVIYAIENADAGLKFKSILEK